MTQPKTTQPKTRVNMIKTKDTLTVVLPSGPYSFSLESPGTQELLDIIRGGAEPTDVERFIKQEVEKIQNAAQALGGDVGIKAGVITYKGEAVHNTLTDRMLDMLDEGWDLAPMAKFLSNLMENPSMRAVNELYGFLEAGTLPITEDGYFLAYKAVRHDFKDIHSGTMDNSVGKVVSMPRNQVDDDKDRTCSYGLHFCSVDYLKSFARQDGHVVILKINPKDVVSIPSDYNNTKGRCSRYEVIGEYKDFDISNPNRDMDVFKETVTTYGSPVSV
jgi:hypothetical protein